MRLRRIVAGALVACVVLVVVVVTSVAYGTQAPGTTDTTIATGTTVTHTESNPPGPAGDSKDSAWTTTTIPPRPASATSEDPPEKTRTLAFVPLAQPGGSEQAYRIVYDAATGQVLAEGAPGEPLAAPSSQGEALLAGGYQTDYVQLNDNTTQDVYNVDLWVYIGGTQGTDYPETWTGTARKTSGYLWFTALQTNIGSTPSDNHYLMHAGIAMANGIHNWWYFSWGGYDHYNNDQKIGDAKGNGIHLYENTWYRIRIWRVNQSGSVWNWVASVKPWPNGTELQAGTWGLTNGRMISNAQYWTELVEPTDVGVTDYTGNHNEWVEYRDAAHGGTNIIYSQGWAHYMTTVTNTNLRSITPYINRYTIDDREIARSNPEGYLLFNNP